MATSAGRILLIPKGNYDAATTYQPLDIVFYNNASYVCKATTLGNAPTNTTYWQIFSEGFDVEQFYANIAPTYNAATTYAAGDHFIYNDVIYTVNVACTGITPPNANYYSVATITGLIEDNTAAISSLNSNVENCALLTQISNPNLLDNPWFTVNQRGFSSRNDNGFTVDRWEILQAAGTISLVNGAINIDPTVSGTTFLWGETVENALAKLSGRVCTLSVMLSDGTIKATTFTFPTSIPSASQIARLNLGSTHWFEVFGYSSGHARVGYYNNNGEIPSSSLTIKAVKLEVGSVSTLAMDAPPNYQQELAKCQRYYQKLDVSGYEIIGYGYATSTTNVRIACNLLVPMRALPTLTVGDVTLLYVFGNAQSITPTAITAYTNYNQNVQLNVTVSGATVNEIYMLKLNNTTFELSADL